MLSIHRPSTDGSIGFRPSSRRFLRPVTAAALIGLLAASAALASSPVTNGYRDQAYGGGAFRPAGDNPQSKLWYTDGQWFAGMFLFVASGTPATPKSEYHIYRLDEATHSWIDTAVVVDTRDQSHGDYLWDESDQTLWVASTSTSNAVSIDDGIRIFKYTYNSVANTYTPFPAVTIPNTKFVAATPTILGGSISVTIDRDFERAFVGGLGDGSRGALQHLRQ